MKTPVDNILVPLTFGPVFFCGGGAFSNKYSYTAFKHSTDGCPLVFFPGTMMTMTTPLAAIFFPHHLSMINAKIVPDHSVIFMKVRYM
jgi:hypothetical protein